MASHFIHFAHIKRGECPERQVLSQRERGVEWAFNFMYYAYIAKDKRNKLYAGITENLQKRINTHNTKQGALFTKSGNFQLVFFEEYSTLIEARRREIQIKKWRREKKENLIMKFNQGLPTKIS